MKKCFPIMAAQCWLFVNSVTILGTCQERFNKGRCVVLFYMVRPACNMLFHLFNDKDNAHGATLFIRASGTPG